MILFSQDSASSLHTSFSRNPANQLVVADGRITGCRIGLESSKRLES